VLNKRLIIILTWGLRTRAQNQNRRIYDLRPAPAKMTSVRRSPSPANKVSAAAVADNNFCIAMMNRLVMDTNDKTIFAALTS
jgi:hypothetical protein